MSPDDGPLARWSRRKAAARAETGRTGGRGGAAPQPVEEAEGAPLPAEAAPAPEAEPDPADYGLPSIDSLGKDSDFTGFLAAGVPEVLKRAALRKLWLSDPVLANLDGLNDYDEDFRALHAAGKAFASNYRVGRGMLSEEERAAEAAEAEAAAETETAAGEAAPEEPSEATPEATRTADGEGKLPPEA